LLRDSRASSALEFAVVGSAMFLITFGAVDLGMILWTQGSLQAVAAEAARCGAIAASGCTTSSAVQTYAQTLAPNWISSVVASGLTINVNSAVTSSCPSISTGTYETVQIISPSLSTWLPPPLNNYTINVCASYAM
jgi:Flp pilus assembly protein TadG